MYSHANAEDLGGIYPWCKFLSKMLRVNLLAYDYTGYGMAFDQGKQKLQQKLALNPKEMILDKKRIVESKNVF